MSELEGQGQGQEQVFEAQQQEPKTPEDTEEQSHQNVDQFVLKTDFPRLLQQYLPEALKDIEDRHELDTLQAQAEEKKRQDEEAAKAKADKAQAAYEAMSDEDKLIKDKIQKRLTDEKYVNQVEKSVDRRDRKHITHDWLQQNPPRIESIKRAIHHLKYNNNLKNADGTDKKVADYDDKDLYNIMEIIYNPSQQLSFYQGYSLGAEIKGGKKRKTLKSKRSKKNKSHRRRK